MKNIAAALLDAQKKIKNAEKDGSNTFFKNQATGKPSGYASLESVLGAVKEHANSSGLAIIQTCGKDPEGHYVETQLLHSSGESVGSKVYLVIDKMNMQGLGSAITYGRRYSLAALFAIGQEDDDGNKASPPDTSFNYGANEPAKADAVKKEPVQSSANAAPRKNFAKRQ